MPCSIRRSSDVEEMTNQYRHTPVLLAECLEHLNLKPQHTFVDSTLGGAGHSSEVAKRLGEGGLLIGIDQDEMALAAAQEAPSLRLPPKTHARSCCFAETSATWMNCWWKRRSLESMRFYSTSAFPHRNSTSRSVASRSGKTPCWTCEWTRVDKP